MKKSFVCLALVLFILTQGCSSIFTSGPQNISVDSEPSGAKVKIGPYSGTTPYNVSIPRGKNYTIQVNYQGEREVVNLEKAIEPVFWVNILFWPGLIVDLATGSMFRYDPTYYDFDFTTQN